jgi:flagellar hook protein FlgE
MSLVGALYVGASGLDAASTELSVVGDNIANSGTVGFKAGRTVFADAMAQQLIGASGQMGLGVTTMTVQKLFSQGGFTTTGLSTDVAVQGNGLFVLKGNHGGEDGTFYTRNGQFTIDKDGYMTNLEGLRVQGCRQTPPAPSRRAFSAICRSAMRPPPPRPRTASPFAETWTRRRRTMTWDPTNPKTTSNFTTSMTVYDSLGKAIQLDIYFLQERPGRQSAGRLGRLDLPRDDRRRQPGLEGDGATPATPAKPPRSPPARCNSTPPADSINNTTTLKRLLIPRIPLTRSP